MTLAHKLTDNMLDLLTKAAVVVLTAIMAVMLVQHHFAAARNAAGRPGSSAEEELQRLQQRADADKKIYPEVAVLFAQRQITQAMDKLKEVQAMHPENPASLLWQARLQYELGSTVEAIASYRQALDAEPGFIDKKSPLFELAVIKQLKERIDESKDKFKREIVLKPNDGSLRAAFDELLYLQRRIAGGCE